MLKLSLFEKKQTKILILLLAAGITSTVYADTAAVTDAPLPDISVSVINKSPNKNHTPTPFEEHMVSFPVIKQQPEKNTSATNPAVKPTLSTMQEANQQLLTADPTHYTIQLTSDHALEDVQSFADDNKLKDKATYFRTKDKQGNDLYVLIYGDYANSADARAALDKLSEETKAEGAFVIKMLSVQNLLKK